MVNRHFSLGCHACRKKHTGCDLTKPECRKCTSKGKECPGYRDTNGFLFIDQAAKTRTRRKRKDASANDENALARIATLPATIPPDPGITSVTFFFNKYITTGRNPLTSRGHFDHLLPLYNQAAPSSLLALAMEVVGSRSVASYYHRSLDSIWHAESLVRASEAMRSAISSPVECLADSTLLAVLLLDFAELIKARRKRTPYSHVHQNAATGLVRLRGARNFESEVSRSLLHATRSNSLRRAMGGYFDADVDMALLAYVTNGEEGMNPALRLDGLIAYAVRLGQRFGKARSGDVVVSLHSQIEKFDGEFWSWWASVPKDWHPEEHTIAQPAAGLGVLRPYPKDEYVFETFGTIDVALIYNQWRVTRLLVIKLLRLCQGVRLLDEKLENEAAGLIKDMWKSVPFFIHGRQLSVLSQGLPDAMQRLQLEEPSGLGTWYLGQILDWAIPILDGEGCTENDKANAAAFKDLREALQSKMLKGKAAIALRSHSV